MGNARSRKGKHVLERKWDECSSLEDYGTLPDERTEESRELEPTVTSKDSAYETGEITSAEDIAHPRSPTLSIDGADEARPPEEHTSYVEKNRKMNLPILPPKPHVPDDKGFDRDVSMFGYSSPVKYENTQYDISPRSQDLSCNPVRNVIYSGTPGFKHKFEERDGEDWLTARDVSEEQDQAESYERRLQELRKLMAIKANRKTTDEYLHLQHTLKSADFVNEQTESMLTAPQNDIQMLLAMQKKQDQAESYERQLQELRISMSIKENRKTTDEYLHLQQTLQPADYVKERTKSMLKAHQNDMQMLLAMTKKQECENTLPELFDTILRLLKRYPISSIYGVYSTDSTINIMCSENSTEDITYEIISHLHDTEFTQSDFQEYVEFHETGPFEEILDSGDVLTTITQGQCLIAVPKSNDKLMGAYSRISYTQKEFMEIIRANRIRVTTSSITCFLSNKDGTQYIITCAHHILDVKEKQSENKFLFYTLVHASEDYDNSIIVYIGDKSVALHGNFMLDESEDNEVFCDICAIKIEVNPNHTNIETVNIVENVFLGKIAHIHGCKSGEIPLKIKSEKYYKNTPEGLFGPFVLGEQQSKNTTVPGDSGAPITDHPQPENSSTTYAIHRSKLGLKNCNLSLALSLESQLKFLHTNIFRFEGLVCLRSWKLNFLTKKKSATTHTHGTQASNSSVKRTGNINGRKDGDIPLKEDGFLNIQTNHNTITEETSSGETEGTLIKRIHHGGNIFEYIF